MQRFPLLLALAFALSGCTNQVVPPPNPDAGPTEFVGRSCNVDAECGVLRCDRVRRQCICLSDSSCNKLLDDGGAAPVRYCNNYTGLCVEMIAGCKTSADCQTSEYCDSNTRACRPLKGFCEGCAADLECGGALDNCILDEVLMQKFCGKSCATTTDCPRGAACVVKNGVKQCWPDKSPVPGQAASCKNFQGCVPDSLRTCNASPDCMDNSQRCDPASGKCTAIVQVCPFGTTCDPRAKICVADCAVDADCGDPKLRCTNRICEPIGECTMDTQCPANKVCAIPAGAATGQCVPFCQADLDCPVGQSCQKVNERYRCAPGCATSSNCLLNQRCNAARSCEGPMVGTARICQATPICNTCELCDLTRNECASAKTGTSAFPYCLQCSAPAECSGGTCVGLDDGKNYCARFCTSGQECPQGFVCLGLTTGQSACVPANRQCSGKCP